MKAIDSRARGVVRTLHSYKPGTPIEEVKRKLGISSVIKLASNENPLGPSPKALVALKGASSSLNRYPDASCYKLREALSKKLKVGSSNITVGNGSDELIVIALRAFIEPGDEVIIADPTFLIYEIQAKACGASIKKTPLKNYRYDLPAMKAAITPRTKMIFIANPDNPTGSYVTKKELDKFLKGLPKHVIIFMDEAYYEFATVKDYPKTIGLIDEVSIIVSRSFSKIYGLAGLRIGYCASRPGIIRAMDSVREPFNVNSLAQAAACAAIKDDAFLRRTLKVTSDGMRYIERELTKLNISFVPSVTNFLLIKIGPKVINVADGLLRQGVIVREMTAWKLSGFIRVTIGTQGQNRRFINALKKVI